MALGPALWLTTLVLTTTRPSSAPGGDRLDCGEPVCWSAVLHEADGQPFSGQGLAQARLGEVLEWTIDIAAPGDAGVFVPTNPALGSFRLVRSVEESLPAPADTNQRRTRTRLQLRALRMGAEAIPPIEVSWRLADGTSGSFETPRQRVRVAGHLDNEQNPALGDRPAPVSVVATNWWLVTLVTLLGGALLAVVLAPLVRRLRRGRGPEPPPPPPRPANEVALERLAWLEQAELPADERYAGAVDALREYLGGRYEFDGLESTTAELMEELAARDVDGVAHAEVQSILDDADLVKFAKLVPSGDEARALIVRVREIVVATWREAPPTDDSDQGGDPNGPEPAQQGGDSVTSSEAGSPEGSEGPDREETPTAEGGS